MGSTPTQIYIDDSGKVHVSYQCDSCSEWVHTDDHCGYGEDYLCPDCFVPATSPEDKEHAMAIDPHAVNCDVSDLSEDMCAEFLRGLGFDVQKRDDDWLIFLVDFDGGNECLVAIHKSIATANRGPHPDYSSSDPEDHISRFGPGTCAMSIHSIDDLHGDVNHVYTLVDEGYIDITKAHMIFQVEGGAK